MYDFDFVESLGADLFEECLSRSLSTVFDSSSYFQLIFSKSSFDEALFNSAWSITADPSDVFGRLAALGVPGMVQDELAKRVIERLNMKVEKGGFYVRSYWRKGISGYLRGERLSQPGVALLGADAAR